DIPIANFSIKCDILTIEKIKQMNEEASILLIGGSGLYSNLANSPSGWYFHCETKLFKEIRVPIVLYAIGAMNNFEYDVYGELSSKARQSIVEINKLSALSSVRDIRTFGILQKMGVSGHCLIADPACFLEPSPIKNLLKKFVAINFIDYKPILKHYSAGLLYIAYMLCASLKKRGYSIIFVAHDCLEHSFYLKIKENFPELLYYNEDNPKEMVYIYSKADFSIGVRCHSNIFSFAGNTPMISLMYDEKQIEFMSSIGMGKYALRIDKNLTLENAVDKIDNIIEKKGRIRKDFAELKKRFLDTELNFVKKVVGLIK
ncbi:unnamed protein product, partial [marine sediment metagenome]